MRNISSKTDNVGDVLPASDFNINHRIELQSIVTDAGFTLDPEGGPDTDIDMLGKSLTIYSNASQYYADTGAANAYEIDRVGNLQPLENLVDGAIVYFKAANTNTGASTINVDSLGAKDLVDNGGSALAGGEITAGNYIVARYNSSTDDFEIIFSNSLITWSNTGTDFIPVVSGSGTIGSTTNLVEGIYLGDNNRIYLGTGQDAEIYYDGSIAYFRSVGNLYIGPTTANSIVLRTSATDRWYINTSGHFVPATANTYNVGGPTAELADIYQADGGNHFFGSDQDMYISHNGTLGTIKCAGNLYIGTGDATSLVFKTADTDRWYINPSGNLIPNVANTYNLGGMTAEIADIYQADGGNHFFGSDQDMYISHNGTLGTIKCAGNLYVGTSDATSLVFETADTERWYVSSIGDLIPFVTATYDIGSATYEVDNVYCVTLVESSGEEDKEDILDTLGLEFILDLNPCSYKMKKGKNKNRKHGLIAQEVLSSIEKLEKTNSDFAAIVHDNSSDKYGISYSQFIAPIIKSIQELNEKIESLIGTL